MRWICVLAVLALTACVGTDARISQSSHSPDLLSEMRPAPIAERLDRVATRILPAASRACRQHNPIMPASYCSFQVKLDPGLGAQPNAYQAIGADGRPVIAFNAAMLNRLYSDDEIAFVMSRFDFQFLRFDFQRA